MEKINFEQAFKSRTEKRKNLNERLCEMIVKFYDVKRVGDDIDLAIVNILVEAGLYILLKPNKRKLLQYLKQLTKQGIKNER
jgi:hypothetical protein